MRAREPDDREEHHGELEDEPPERGLGQLEHDQVDCGHGLQRRQEDEAAWYPLVLAALGIAWALLGGEEQAACAAELAFLESDELINQHRRRLTFQTALMVVRTTAVVMASILAVVAVKSCGLRVVEPPDTLADLFGAICGGEVERTSVAALVSVYARQE